MFKTQCPVCSNDYENYEDVCFIYGHGMCVDCYEDRNTPNNGFQETAEAYGIDFNSQE